MLVFSSFTPVYHLYILLWKLLQLANGSLVSLSHISLWELDKRYRPSLLQKCAYNLITQGIYFWRFRNSQESTPRPCQWGSTDPQTKNMLLFGGTKIIRLKWEWMGKSLWLLVWKNHFRFLRIKKICVRLCVCARMCANMCVYVCVYVCSFLWIDSWAFIYRQLKFSANSISLNIFFSGFW